VESDDFIISSLEFVHAEYSVMAQSLQEKIKAGFPAGGQHGPQSDETMSLPEEEEKEEGKLENIDSFAKDIINKLKLPELFGKVIDRLVSDEELYLQVDRSLFTLIKKYLD
jgi:hypothetical protein